jgi:hypothetical protein
VLFEIKPDNEEGRQEGKEQAGRSSTATERTAEFALGASADLLLEVYVTSVVGPVP